MTDKIKAMSVSQNRRLAAQGADFEPFTSNKRMTDDQLNELEARAKAAKPGPWHIHEGDLVTDATHEDVGSDWEETSVEDAQGNLTVDMTRSPDWNFICHARDEVLDLIAELRRERERIPVELKGAQGDEIVAAVQTLAAELASEREKVKEMEARCRADNYEHENHMQEIESLREKVSRLESTLRELNTACADWKRRAFALDKIREDG